MAHMTRRPRHGAWSAFALALGLASAAQGPVPASAQTVSAQTLLAQTVLAQAASEPAPAAKPEAAKPEHARRLVGLDVASASARPGPSGQAEVLVKLGERSKDALALFTKAHVGKEIEVMVAGQAVSRAKLVEPLTAGELVLTDQKAAEELASRLSSRQATLELRVAAN